MGGGWLPRARRVSVSAALMVLGAVALPGIAAPIVGAEKSHSLGLTFGELQRGDEDPYFGEGPERLPALVNGSDVEGAAQWVRLDHVPADFRAFEDDFQRFDLRQGDTAALFGSMNASPALVSMNAEQARLGLQADYGLPGVSDGILQMARDLILEQGDNASFSFAGLEVNVALKGQHRAVTVNGYDVLSTVRTLVHGEESAAARADQGRPDPMLISVSASTQLRDDVLDPRVVLAKAREVVSDPMTLFILVVMALMWVVVRVLASVPETGGRRRR